MAGAVLVDANVLLDVLTADPQWLSWSSTELRQAKAGGVVAVNPIICAALASPSTRHLSPLHLPRGAAASR